MVAIDSHLTPEDARVALQSFPRRFRAVFARPDDDAPDPDELARRYGRAGVSAVEHLAAADGVVGLVAQALGSAGRRSTPLDAMLGDLAGSTWSDPGGRVDALLDRFESTAASAAEAVDATSTDQWGETVAVTGTDAGPTRLQLVREAVAIAADRLRSAEAVLREVR